MKYIITESKLENIIFKYLDSKDLYLLSTVNSRHFFYSRKSIDDGEYPIISYDNKNKDCFVSSAFVEDVCSLFSIDPEYSLKVISEWVGNKLDVEIESYNSDFDAD
jgi:hypothetical protein